MVILFVFTVSNTQTIGNENTSYVILEDHSSLQSIWAFFIRRKMLIDSIVPRFICDAKMSIEEAKYISSSYLRIQPAVTHYSQGLKSGLCSIPWM